MNKQSKEDRILDTMQLALWIFAISVIGMFVYLATTSTGCGL